MRRPACESSGVGAAAAWLPEDIAANAEIGAAGEDEEQVRQTVEVERGERVDRLAVLLNSPPRGALGAPDHLVRELRVDQGRDPGVARGDLLLLLWGGDLL